ncbi:HAD family hydrolase [Listeria fleischmannii]|uniref:HAD family hydrolase n=1 Tax=Listeria fleischmannii TaxID=1069827 RepID=UPI000680C7C4|nr:HAD hydrolase family protein [Listeria fleischmannii]
MEKYLICTDLDGTLLNCGEIFNLYPRRLLRKLMKEGHYFSVATGRLFHAANEFAKFSSNGPIVSRRE